MFHIHTMCLYDSSLTPDLMKRRYIASVGADGRVTVAVVNFYQQGGPPVDVVVRVTNVPKASGNYTVQLVDPDHCNLFEPNSDGELSPLTQDSYVGVPIAYRRSSEMHFDVESANTLVFLLFFCPYSNCKVSFMFLRFSLFRACGASDCVSYAHATTNKPNQCRYTGGTVVVRQHMRNNAVMLVTVG